MILQRASLDMKLPMFASCLCFILNFVLAFGSSEQCQNGGNTDIKPILWKRTPAFLMFDDDTSRTDFSSCILLEITSLDRSQSTLDGHMVEIGNYGQKFRNTDLALELNVSCPSILYANITSDPPTPLRIQMIYADYKNCFVQNVQRNTGEVKDGWKRCQLWSFPHPGAEAIQTCKDRFLKSCSSTIIPINNRTNCAEY